MSSNELYKEVGKRIREARELRNLTQERLAQIISLTRTSITNIERGNQKLLLHTLIDIALALGVEPCSLLPDKVSSSNDTRMVDKLPSDLSKDEQDWIQSVVAGQNKEG